MHSWGFALREGVFAETKEGKCKNIRELREDTRHAAAVVGMRNANRSLQAEVVGLKLCLREGPSPEALAE